MEEDQNSSNLHKEKSRETQIKELGAKLAEIREAQKLSIDDAWSATKIQKKYLVNIEAGQLEKLPKGPFCRSFLRQYCDYLNAADLWERYDRLTKRENNLLKLDKLDDDAEPTVPSRPKIFRPTSYLWIYMIIAISLGAAIWITWQYRGDISSDATTPLEGGTAPIAEQRAREAAPPAVSAEPAPATAVSGDAASVDLNWMDGKPPAPKAAAPAAALSGDAALSADAAAGQAAGGSVLKVVPTATIWIKATSGRKTLYEGLMKVGESKEFSPEASDVPLRVRYGNPARTTIAWGGGAEAPAAVQAKPLTKYYWSDGAVTDGAKREQAATQPQ